MLIRSAVPADLGAIASIQASSPEGAHWEPADYLAHELFVAIFDGNIAGFLAGRRLADGEHEVLNLAVAPAFRRRGIARELVARFAGRGPGSVFLEVRKSNTAARCFYKSIGFQEVAVRNGYYDIPPEDGIVMKFHSC